MFSHSGSDGAVWDGVLSPSGWRYPLTDGLTRVRGVTDAGGSVVETTDYSPLGVPTTPLTRTPYHFTGEMRDGVGLQTHRARHDAPSLGTWTALDPFEGVMGRPMSLNGYTWVEGNTPNATDLSGMFAELGLFYKSIDLDDILYSSICLSKNQQTTPIPPSLGSSNLTDSTW